MDPIQALHHHLPEAVLALLASVVLILGVLPASVPRIALPWASVAAVLAAMLLLDWSGEAAGAFGVFPRFLVLLVGLLVLSAYWPDVDAEAPGEFLSAILFCLSGALLVAGADDLITLFLGLELVSLPTYLLLAAGRRHLEAQEAGGKYFFLSVLSAAVMLYGFSFLYGVTGTLRLSKSDPTAYTEAARRVREADGRLARLEADAAAADRAVKQAPDAETRQAAEAARTAMEPALTTARDAARDQMDLAVTACDDLAGRVELLLRSRSRESLAMLMFGLILVVAGLGFKLAAVPFHFYAPDVYQGAHSAVAGMMAFLPKAAGVLALLKVAVAAMAPLAHADAVGAPALPGMWVELFAILAVASMIVGNTVALCQSNIKRLLAYSSIAHSGYILVALAALVASPAGLSAESLTTNAGAALLFYVLTYGVMTLGAFAALSMVQTASGEPAETLDDVAGLARRQPLVAAAIAVFFFSLTGLPPTAGFIGKLGLFGSTLSVASAGGESANLLYALVAVGVVNSAISAVYYLFVVREVYLREPVGRQDAPDSTALPFAVGLCAALTLAWGVAPNLFGAVTQSLNSAKSLPVRSELVKPLPPAAVTVPAEPTTTAH